jgi:hypothetical protein
MSAIPEEVKGRGLVEATWMHDGEPRSAAVAVDGYDAARVLATHRKPAERGV